MSFDYEGSTIETDENGYLITLEDWSEGVAGKLAEDEEIEMNDEHWEIINFLRDYYQEFQIAPAVKVLTKAIAKKNDIHKKEASVFCMTFFQTDQGCRPVRSRDCLNLPVVFDTTTFKNFAARRHTECQWCGLQTTLLCLNFRI